MPKRNPVFIRFGQNVRKRREAGNLTQEALAELASLDRTYISDVERGSRNISLQNIVRVADALATHPARLMEGIR